MNDLRESMSHALDGEPPLPNIADALIADGHRRRRRQRLAATTAVVVSSALAVAIVVPIVLGDSAPGGLSPAQAAISPLVSAAARGSQTIPPKHYLHVVDRIAQGGERDVVQTWTNPKGLRWYSYSPSMGTPSQVTWGDDDTANPSLRYLDSLPTSASELSAYLDGHVSGSSTKDEAIFTAVGDILRLTPAPSALRAAAFQVLQTTPHITVAHVQDSSHRHAVEVTFHDPTGANGPQSLLFDPKTSALLEERQGPQFTATYTEDLVTAVPGNVRKQAGPPPPQPAAG